MVRPVSTLAWQRTSMSGADSSFDVRVAASAAQLRRAYCLRIQVFGTEYGYGEDNEVDQCVPVLTQAGL